MELNIELERGGEVEGVVQSRGGQPVSRAAVTLRGPKLGVSMQKPGEFAIYSGSQQVKAVTGADGSFALRLLPGADHVAVSHTEGWASVPVSTLPSETVVLQPWGRIEGIVRVGGRVPEHVEVMARGRGLAPGQLLYDFNTKPDAEGRFEFSKVPAGRVELALITRPGNIGVFSHGQFAEIQAGATIKVTLGGSGARVTGRLVVTPARSDIGWNKSSQHLNRLQRDEGSFIGRNHGFFCHEDGSFVVEDVAPGGYVLSLQVAARDDTVDAAGNVRSRTLGTARRDVSIPDSFANGGTLELGDIEITVK